MKSFVPWVFILILLAAVGWLYAANHQLAAQVALLRQDSEALNQLRAEAEQKSQPAVASEAAAQQQKEREELLRLRNQVRQLREENLQLSRQLQAAQAQTQAAQNQAQAAQAQSSKAAAVPPTPGTRLTGTSDQGQGLGNLTSEQAAAFQRRYGLAPGTPAATTPEQANLNTCLNNLRQIETAKQQWAQEHGKGKGALFTASDLAPYLPGNALPNCPAGGAYTLNPVGYHPICNVSTHVLSK